MIIEGKKNINGMTRKKTRVPVPVSSPAKWDIWLDELYGSSDLKYYELDKLQIVQKLSFRMISLPDG